MSSSYKTPYLGLNKFVGTDKPKMDDFNFDNNRLDSKIQEHIQGTSHITAAERTKWNGVPFVMGSYVGTGTTPRQIPIGFDATFGLVFAVNQTPLQFISVATQTNQYSGYFSSLGCSFGISLIENGIQVLSFTGNAVDGKRSLLNQSGTTYIYIAFA